MRYNKLFSHCVHFVADYNKKVKAMNKIRRVSEFVSVMMVGGKGFHIITHSEPICFLMAYCNSNRNVCENMHRYVGRGTTFINTLFVY